MELLGQYLQPARKHSQQQQQDDLHWIVLRAVFLWAAIIYCIVAVALIAFGPSNQESVIEAVFRTAGILIRCFYRLSVDGERILSEFLAQWHSINVTIDRIL